MLAAGGAILFAAPEAGRRLVAGGTLLPAFHDDFVALSVYSKRAVGWKARVFSGASSARRPTSAIAGRMPRAS